ncbi:four-carbon acid sugar kinase family protein [Actinoplanes sp. GCM10030250]|uniref:four-carbon acid sugar kinase family protein n=1 Tax=Actinoplanes sp. GCM10030250 TaxID=3273376 RepID=UPI0036182602
MRPRMLGLVADDLTGATDAAVPFAAAGWSAHLLRGTAAIEPGGDRPCLLAVATGVRAAGDDEAAAVTAAAVRDLLARGCDRLYLKVDSTMRGSVAAQLRGALAGWSQAHPGAVVVLCPAFPEQGRTVTGGRVLVGGVPLARTAAARDPVTPVTSSLLSDLLSGTAGLTTTDAGTDADLDAIAADLDRSGSRRVAAGSAGLASALARRWPVAGFTPDPLRPSRRILVAVSSLHPVALSAVERLRAARPAVDVITTPTSRATAVATAASFGKRVAHQLTQIPYDAVVLVGGDGAAAVLDHVRADAVTVHSALAPGVPIGTIRGGPAHGVHLVTRSGGFGSAGSLVDIVDQLGTTGKEHP